MWKYSSTLMDHFMNPRNSGQLPDPDGRSEVGSDQCGDAMTLDIQVDDRDRIVDIRFMTFGCAGAIAAASALTELARGRTLEEALTITNDQIIEYLGGMPEEKYHCSVMGHEALEGAIGDFRKKRERVRRHLEQVLENMPAQLKEDLGGEVPAVVNVHPSRVTLRSSAGDGDAAESLGRLLEGKVGRRVEVTLLR
ncbi:MAG: hypothetical protein AVO35_12890 [Candidatus Aegiribacteria sp. MLS_C]|nr:MAG: hypothetical protein AVO35_12890 [Candidatus Aegiribacteria sp. MLS_C]